MGNLKYIDMLSLDQLFLVLVTLAGAHHIVLVIKSSNRLKFILQVHVIELSDNITTTIGC